MALQIKSMEDLVDHLSGLEQRINELEVKRQTALISPG